MVLMTFEQVRESLVNKGDPYCCEKGCKEPVTVRRSMITGFYRIEYCDKHKDNVKPEPWDVRDWIDEQCGELTLICQWCWYNYHENQRSCETCLAMNGLEYELAKIKDCEHCGGRLGTRNRDEVKKQAVYDDVGDKWYCKKRCWQSANPRSNV